LFCSLLREGKQSWDHFAHQPCGRSVRPSISSSGCRNADFRMQECRSITPSQDAGMIVLCMGEWDTHSSALSLQTQQLEESLIVKNQYL
jgi:hypothetical protein